MGKRGFGEEARELIQAKRKLVRKGSPLYLAQNVAHRGAQSDLLNKFTLIAINPPLLWGK